MKQRKYIVFSPDFHHPGFARVTFSPCLVPQLARVDMTYSTPNGTLAVHWERQPDGAVDIDLTLPAGTVADVRLPGLAPAEATGTQHFTVRP
ncbi:MAG: alpha-L-rhamnosidase C-terminal domain-containing protein [Candidatus Enterosoma sp.]